MMFRQDNDYIDDEDNTDIIHDDDCNGDDLLSLRKFKQAGMLVLVDIVLVHSCPVIMQVGTSTK